MVRFFLPFIFASVLIVTGSALLAQPQPYRDTVSQNEGQVVGEFLLLLFGSDEGKRDALDFVATHWQPGFTPMMIEALSFNRDPAFGSQLVRVLEQQSGQSLGYDINSWLRWQWNQAPNFHPQYAEFKSALYGLIDPAFENYFAADRYSDIRLDEVVWGGVKQDGIPPLRDPVMLAAGEADYLAATDVVFGLSVNGDARAYPRRILGWHEMFVDEVGGVPVAGVYCTLCGTMMLYKTELKGVNHQLGTSGFLYRSNKLMFDKDTQSLWNTIWGKAVIGPLAREGVTLERLGVVTTTWGEWRQRHPDSKVLSLATGHARDYAEDAAYRDYFATDELMFQVPKLDRRLKNKAEVLGLVFAQYPEQPLAIAAAYLQDNSLYQDKIGELRFVVVTDPSGANRVYESDDVEFVDFDGRNNLDDSSGRPWQLSEATLRRGDGRLLHRLPAQRAFWFGWFSAYSHTRLVH